ncbi:gp23.1 [Bacillus phage SPO1]|uniref:Gp23.1 n=3 Tax=Okubovirus TaxID=1857845 RepID=B6V2L0_BPSP1|nr:gp23.1 [Bacillus phage SPO1]YP_008770054.1 hypothetical protein CampHawk_120 [Bacillus phage CampHawk]APZ82355.1 hypothetical protein Goe2_c11900 [Bacillus phage vB_BsuM-Goe2]UNY49070.1 hypothetical protein sp82g_133 [Bacillus phage SP82G]WCS68759.1 hypothetical protein Goe19_01180 [Bacillus phage vB_BsuM-Goe19]ACI91023.1 gp23.1 [Bacillus phage SPO1]AGY46998.1 hypothetical protein CampHawk_120 [Bacillus phage CampHawk]
MAKNKKNLTEEERKAQKEKQYLNKVVTRGEVLDVLNGALKPHAENQDNLWQQQRLLYIQLQCVVDVLIDKGILTKEELEKKAEKIIKETQGLAAEILGEQEGNGETDKTE